MYKKYMHSNNIYVTGVGRGYACTHMHMHRSRFVIF